MFHPASTLCQQRLAEFNVAFASHPSHLLLAKKDVSWPSTPNACIIAAISSSSHFRSHSAPTGGPQQELHCTSGKTALCWGRACWNRTCCRAEAVFVTLQCLWTPPIAASASAVASATSTTGSATATAIATATATATATASATATVASLLKEAPQLAGTCSLNPSHFFSLQAAGGGPSQDSEKWVHAQHSCSLHSMQQFCPFLGLAQNIVSRFAPVWSMLCCAVLCCAGDVLGCARLLC